MQAVNSARNQKIRDDLADLVKGFKRRRLSYEAMREMLPQELQELKRQLQADYVPLDKAMRLAIRARMAEQPTVARWIRQRRIFGGKKDLRRLRLGLEKGVSAGFSASDTFLLLEAPYLVPKFGMGKRTGRALAARLKSGRLMSQAALQLDWRPGEKARLIKRLEDMTRQQLRKKLEILGLVLD